MAATRTSSKTQAANKAAKKVRGAGPRDPERTSASILAAAVTEFTEKGYAGARIDAIAERSGANKRMIYHYFGDKDGLYLAVLESAYGGIRSAEAELHLTDLEPVAGHRAAGRLHLGLFHRAPGIPEHPEHREPASRQVPQEVETRASASLAAGVDDLGRAEAGRRARRVSAAARIRFMSTSPSPRSASSICRTAGRCRPSSPATCGAGRAPGLGPAYFRGHPGLSAAGKSRLTAPGICN